MVSDQIVSLLSIPTKAGASFAVPSIVGLLRNSLSEAMKPSLRVHTAGNEAFICVYNTGNKVDTSERLFLINPTMAVGCEASLQPSWGVYPA